ncbi:Uncharacterised protein [Serratia rubidaea]|nr:Uncharacterised protein [Serratia rubidaea]
MKKLAFYKFIIGWGTANLAYAFAFLWLFIVWVIASHTVFRHEDYFHFKKILFNIITYGFNTWLDFAALYSTIFALLWALISVYRSKSVS